MTTPRRQTEGPRERSAFHFGTKAETLARLAPLVELPEFCDQVVVPVARWQSHRAAVIENILEAFEGKALAVRSSTTMEDGWENSNAGSFLSLTDVAPEQDVVADAIDRVIASYDGAVDGQEVLVQAMIGDVALSGVVLTRDLDTGSPYYVIDYDDFSGRTDTVTGGAESKTVLVHRANPDALHSPRMRAIIAVVREIEAVTGSESLDIEFCVTSEIKVYVLQVRPLAARRRWQTVPDGDIDRAIAQVRAAVGARQRPQPGLAGRTTILGEMPDWNPAEMIGNTPRRLAISLYGRLITDRTWSRARAIMGYRDVPHALMVELAGRPYIDVRLSLNSFLPADLDDGLADRLVDAEIAMLAERPDLHDKIEFEVAFTCRDVNFRQRSAVLAESGLSTGNIDALGTALGALTARCVTAGPAGIEALVARSRRLLHRAPAADPHHALDRARALLGDTVSSGTLPFSILARHAFIGTAFLRSFVARGALAAVDVQRFMRGVHTIAGEVVNAIHEVARGSMKIADFLARYGHLRPGTYDIVSWRYDERPDLYLGDAGRPAPPTEAFRLDSRQRAAISACLAEEGFGFGPDDLFAYISAAIAAREEAKFAFTRGISDALVAIARWGEDNGFSREDLSHLDIRTILDGANDRARLADAVSEATERHRLSRALRLPHLIVEPDDIDVVRPLRGRPTFITNASVTARARRLHSDEVVPLDGHIVLIENADPGYDWIFAHDIAGLVTKYGGANSHMAIRCAEFGLPAAIGCGEHLFDILLRASVIELNCAARKAGGR